MWLALPTPAVPTRVVRPFIHATSSLRLFAATPFRATISWCALGRRAIGSRSFNKSYRSVYIAPLMTCVLQLPTLRVYPSGDAWTARPTPTLPPAPATFSMMIGWPRLLLMGPAMARATVSVGPPAANGTTNVIPCAGYSAAIADEQREIAIIAAASDFLMVGSPEATSRLQP